MKHPVPFRNTPLVLAIAASLTSPTLIQAAPGDPLGPEFRVNTYTTGPQVLPTAAMDADGDLVVAWGSYQDGSYSGIYAQRYNSAGVAQGAEFRVNTFTTGSQSFPTVTMDADGDFVVVWASNGQDSFDYNIYAQRYDRAGVAQGPEFRVNTFTTGSQSFPTVTMDADGDFVVAWESFGQDGSYWGIYAQRYNSAGVAQGPEFQVNTYTTSPQTRPTVAMDADGDFVVAWSSFGYSYDYSYSDGQDGSGSGIYVQRYNSAGVAQGTEFQVNTYTTDRQQSPAVAMDADGDFVVAWESEHQDGYYWGIYAQRYNSAGVAQGAEFRVNTSTIGFQRLPTVAMDSDGDFVVAWRSYGLYGALRGIYAQRYDRAGVPQGSEFRVNTSTTSSQGNPTVAMDADGDFVVAWSSYAQDGSDWDICAQRYAGPVSGDSLTTVGLYDPAASRFYLRNSHAGGPADTTFRFGPGGLGWLPLSGDWSGDGTATIGLYDPIAGQFYLRNSLAGGPADLSFRFGPREADWQPLSGDWDGNGQATVGLYNLVSGTFFLKNSPVPGPADIHFRFGPQGFGWQAIAGDWDGDGITTVGLYDPVTSRFYLNNRLAGGAADLSFRFGQGNQSQVPLAGDWDGDGVDTVGLYDPATSRFYLNNRHAGGAADLSFRFGRGGFGWLPVTGQWTGP